MACIWWRDQSRPFWHLYFHQEKCFTVLCLCEWSLLYEGKPMPLKFTWKFSILLPTALFPDFFIKSATSSHLHSTASKYTKSWFPGLDLTGCSLKASLTPVCSEVRDWRGSFQSHFIDRGSACTPTQLLTLLSLTDYLSFSAPSLWIYSATNQC